MLLAFAAMLAAGCGKKSGPDVLARVGGQVITVEDFKAELQRRNASRKPLPDRQTLLEEMIARAALVERARAAGLDQALKCGAPSRTYDRQTRAGRTGTQAGRGEGFTEEIRAAYEQDAARFTQPAKAHLAIVYLAADSETDTNRLAEISARANEARQLALALPAAEKGFGRVAADYSEDQISRYRGGDAGWFTGDFSRPPAGRRK